MGRNGRKLDIDDFRGFLARGGYEKRCESAYRARVRNTAADIMGSGREIVMLAGPSGSGKTTTAKLLCREFEKNGRSAAMVSLDDFFYDREKMRLPDGSYDFDSPAAVDAGLLDRCVTELLETGATYLPAYDFKTGLNTKNARYLDAAGGVVIIEGIHAHNPDLLSGVPDGRVYRLYVEPGTVYLSEGRKLLEGRDIRLARRMIRDIWERDHDPSFTLEQWSSVVEAEEKWIIPNSRSANRVLDSSLPYEPGLYTEYLEAMARKAEGGEYHPVLQQMAEVFSMFPEIPFGKVPPESLLCEFIGNYPSLLLN